MASSEMANPDSGRCAAPFRPLRPVVRVALLVVGTLALALGVVGILLPILPTTPLMLLAAGCYVRSSDRLARWLLNHPRLGAPVRVYVRQRAIPLKVKVVSLAVAWAMLGGSALFLAEQVWLKALLIGIALAKTALMLRVPTLAPDVLAAEQRGCAEAGE